MKLTPCCLSTALVFSAILCCRAEHVVPRAETKITPPSPEYLQRIRDLAPAKATVEPGTPRKVLLVDRFTGFHHLVIPHVTEATRILGEKTGAFSLDVRRDLQCFEPASLAQYDALILNNTCSQTDHRNFFLDALREDAPFKEMTSDEQKARAGQLEQNLLGWVASGKGLVVVHGGITFLNKSSAFGEMVGGNFAFHPPKETITLDLVEPDHPMLAAFAGESYVHFDEPYVFGGPYKNTDFRPLLVINAEKLKPATAKRMGPVAHYAAWIKPYHKGRVFYCSPSHQPESYESAALLRFYLDGIQYAIGDLKCDDAPRNP